eukprot:tig00000093_g3500.t1
MHAFAAPCLAGLAVAASCASPARAASEVDICRAESAARVQRRPKRELRPAPLERAFVGQPLRPCAPAGRVSYAATAHVPRAEASSSSGLAGKTVIITRAASQANEFQRLLEAEGARVLEVPSLEIVPPASYEELDAGIAGLAAGGFDWLVLTSANAVDYFFARVVTRSAELTAEKSGESFAVDERAEAQAACAGVRIAVVGKKTQVVLARWGLEPDFVPPDFDADSLLANFPGREAGLQGVRVLFPRVQSGGREVLTKGLRELGAEVAEVAAYESRCPALLPDAAVDALLDGEVDFVTFASSKTVANFAAMLRGSLAQRAQPVSIIAGAGAGTTMEVHEATAEEALEGVALASIGPQTSRTCRELLGRVDVEAAEYTLEGLARAMAAHPSPHP